MIPNGWQKRRFGDFCIEVVRRAEEEELPVLSVSKDHGLLLQSEKFKRRIASKDTARYKRIRYGEFAYDPMLLWSGSIGRQRRIAEGIISPAYYAFQTDSTIDPEFLEALLRWTGMRPKFADISQGTNVRRRKASFEDFCALTWTFPSLQEQHKIATILSSVDDTIKKTQTVIDQLENVKKGLARELLTRGVPGQHKEFKETEVGQIPSQWLYVRAADVCTSITKGTTPAAHEMRDESGEIPFLKVYNIDPSGFIDFSVKPTFVAKPTHNGVLARSKVLPGDVVMNIVGPPLGKVAIIPKNWPEWNINQAIGLFRPSQSVDSRFLYECLRAEHLFAWARSRAKRTSTQLNLTLEICRDFPIPLPPIDEQSAIADALASVSSAYSTNLRMLEGLRETKSELANALFSGQLRVNCRGEAA